MQLGHGFWNFSVIGIRYEILLGSLISSLGSVNNLENNYLGISMSY